MRSHRILVEKIKGDFHFKSASVIATHGLISLKKKRKGIKALKSGNTCTKKELKGHVGNHQCQHGQT